MRNIAVITPVASGPHRKHVFDAISTTTAFPHHFVVLDGPGSARELDAYDRDRVTITETAYAVGRSEARNVGLTLARDAGFEWSIFLDADDLMLPTAWTDLQEAPEADMYYAEHMFGEGGQTWNHIPWSTTTRDELMESPPRAKLIIANVSFMVRTERATRILFDPDIAQGEHFDFFVKYMASPAVTALMLPRPLITVRRELSSNRFGPWIEGSKEKYAKWAQVTV